MRIRVQEEELDRMGGEGCVLLAGEASKGGLRPEQGHAGHRPGPLRIQAFQCPATRFTPPASIQPDSKLPTVSRFTISKRLDEGDYA